MSADVQHRSASKAFRLDIVRMARQMEERHGDPDLAKILRRYERRLAKSMECHEQEPAA